MADMLSVVSSLADVLQSKQLRLVTAESCTGGGVASVLTDLAGSSQWFERGFVTYSNDAKMDCLNVPATVLERYGAVSEETVRAMVKGAVTNSLGDVALAVSGIAGPGGGTESKPVGTVCFAWGNSDVQRTGTRLFSGDRHQVREQAVEHAITGMLSWVNSEF